jgi:phosphatidylglycerophosphate synthase
MFDALLRPLIDRPLDAAGRTLARRGITANSVTLGGALIGLGAALAIGNSHYGLGLLLITLNRLLDGLDGAVARATQRSDAGGYLDSICDYLFYAAVPLAFAWANPAHNALPGAALLASFVLTCASFLAFAAIAGQRGLASSAQGQKSFFYSRGLIEGTETIACFIAMTLWPANFPMLAWTFAGLCVLTAAQRSTAAWQTFRR